MSDQIDQRYCVIYENQPDGVTTEMTITSEYSEPQTVTHDLTEKAHIVERSYDGAPRTLCGAFAAGDCDESDNPRICPRCAYRAIDMGWL